MSKKYKKSRRRFRKKHIVYNNDILLLIHPKIKQIIKETDDKEICIRILKEYSKYKTRQPKYQEYQFYRNEKKPIKENEKCFICKTNYAYCNHHIQLLINGGGNEDYNLIPICKSCHKKIHDWLK